jgi:hypothetical protein
MRAARLIGMPNQRLDVFRDEHSTVSQPELQSGAEINQEGHQRSISLESNIHEIGFLECVDVSKRIDFRHGRVCASVGVDEEFVDIHH